MTAGRDPGAQPERTRLAWRRTTLAFGIVLVLILRRLLLHPPSPADYVITACAVLGWAGFLALAQRRIRTLAGATPPAAGAWHAMLAAGYVVVAAACGTATLF